MQHRMKTHQLTAKQMDNVLKNGLAGTLATVNVSGAPYITPLHYLYDNGKIYFHGLPKGMKIDNIQRNPHVCFNVYNMEGLLLDSAGVPCDTNTKYQSVTAQGTAEIVSDMDRKRVILNAIVDKYTPQYSGYRLPDNMVRGTAVVVINITALTGKYWE